MKDLTPDPNNPRSHSEDQIQAVMGSLVEFGQDQPIVVQRQGNIIRKGNCRYKAAKRLGWNKIAAVFVDEEDIRAIARGVTDNRTADMADYHYSTLAEVLKTLQAAGSIDLAKLGWKDHELSPFLQEDWTPPKVDEPIPESDTTKKPSSKDRQKAIHFDPGDYRIIAEAATIYRDKHGKSELSISKALTRLCRAYVNQNS